MLEENLGKAWGSRKQLGWRVAAVYRNVVVGSARRVKDLKRAVMVRTEYAGLIYIPSQVPDISHHQLPWRHTTENDLYCSYHSKWRGACPLAPHQLCSSSSPIWRLNGSHHDPSLQTVEALPRLG